MSEVVNFAEAKAMASGDCRDWTALDALKAVIRDIENGNITMPTMIYIAIQRPSDQENTSLYTSYMAGGKTLELLGLLVKHQFITANEHD